MGSFSRTRYMSCKHWNDYCLVWRMSRTSTRLIELYLRLKHSHKTNKCKNRFIKHHVGKLRSSSNPSMLDRCSCLCLCLLYLSVHKQANHETPPALHVLAVRLLRYQACKHYRSARSIKKYQYNLRRASELGEHGLPNTTFSTPWRTCCHKYQSVCIDLKVGNQFSLLRSTATWMENIIAVAYSASKWGWYPLRMD